MKSLNIDNLIRQAYGDTVASLGKDIWRQGRVLHFDSQDLTGVTLVDGAVKGSRQLPYDVTIEIEMGHHLHMSGQCNCPHEFDCKHCAALGYAWLARQERSEAPVRKPVRGERQPERQPERPSDRQMARQPERHLDRQPERLQERQPRVSNSRQPRDGQREPLPPRDSYREPLPPRDLIEGPPRREPAPRRGRQDMPREDRSQGSQQLKAWLGRLRKRVAPPPPTDRNQLDRLIYLLTVNGNQARIELRSRDTKRGRNGSRLTRPEPLSKLIGPQARHTPEDHEIGRLLFSLAEPGPAAKDASLLTLKGAAGALALDLILASGRCRMQNPDGLRLNQGESRPLSFCWRQTGRGWTLQGMGSPPVKQVFQIDGPWYFDSVSRDVGPLETEMDPGLVEELFKAPAVQKNQIEAATKSLNQMFPEIALELPKGARVEIEQVSELEPEPLLVLRGLPREGRDPVYVAQLAFDYAGALLAPAGDDVAVRLEQKGRIFLIDRELEAEAEWREQLPERNLEALGDGVTYVLPGDGSVAQAQAWEYFLRVEVPALEEQGWAVDIAEDFSLKVYGGESGWEAKIEEDEKAEWFDLSLGIELDGRPVNLLPLLESLLRSATEPEELLERLAKEENILLPVGPEQWLRVPCDRIKGVLAALIELYDDDALNADGSIRLNWTQGLGLGSLLTDPDFKWEGGDSIRQLAHHLQDAGTLPQTEVPKGFKATLRPYQHDGLNWLQFLRQFGFHGILADDMGLGKTIQTLAHLLIEKQSGRADKPSLVVAPTSVVPNWRREAEKFAPDLKVLVLHGPERAELFEKMHEYDLILTTYALIRLDAKQYLPHSFHLLILDEAQAIKNPASQTAKAVCKLNARHRLALSGTPVENHLAELWSIYRYLMPGFLGSADTFTTKYRTPIEKHGDIIRADALRKRLRPFLLRRKKLDVAQDLPPKTEMIQYVGLSGAQRDLYETIRVALDQSVREEISKIGLKRSQIMLLDALLKLRQICCDPRLLKLDEAKKVKDSAKLEWLLETVPEMVEEGRRILIFSQFVSMLDLIEAGLKKAKVKSLRLTGETKKRETVVDAFQLGDAPVFLVSLKAGGVGINLTAADTVIHYDPWWNPAVENQATDRAWRIGQDKPVFVYKLICEQTVEEKILQLQAKKAQLSEGIFSAEGEGSLRLEAEELLALLEG